MRRMPKTQVLSDQLLRVLRTEFIDNAMRIEHTVASMGRGNGYEETMYQSNLHFKYNDKRYSIKLVNASVCWTTSNSDVRKRQIRELDEMAVSTLMNYLVYGTDRLADQILTIVR